MWVFKEVPVKEKPDAYTYEIGYYHWKTDYLGTQFITLPVWCCVSETGDWETAMSRVNYLNGGTGYPYSNPPKYPSPADQ